MQILTVNYVLRQLKFSEFWPEYAQATLAPAVWWSSCEIRVSEIIIVCMGIFTMALKNKKESQTLYKKNLALLSQCIACYLTAYYVEKNPF